jgi:hypothetical protein
MYKDPHDPRKKANAQRFYLRHPHYERERAHRTGRCKTYFPPIQIRKWRNKVIQKIRELKWDREHPERVKELSKSWAKNNPKKQKELWIKHSAKRRKLGFILINEPFEGSEAHHLDKETVFYIPKIANEKIKHNVWTGQGMNEINAIILDSMLIGAI